MKQYLPAELEFKGHGVPGKKTELSQKFDEEMKLLTDKSETMGITEQILDMARQLLLRRRIVFL